jgi:hypothetical protein
MKADEEEVGSAVGDRQEEKKKNTASLTLLWDAVEDGSMDDVLKILEVDLLLTVSSRCAQE